MKPNKIEKIKLYSQMKLILLMMRVMVLMKIANIGAIVLGTIKILDNI